MSMNKVSSGHLLPPIIQGYIKKKGSKVFVKEHITGILEGQYDDSHIIMTRITRSDKPIDIREYYRSKKTPPRQPVIINLLDLNYIRFLQA